MSVRKNKKMSLAEDAYERLRDEILDNKLPAGSQAMEPEIAAHLQMSRTPVREALLRLESDGLVELIPRRGFRVLPLSPNDMREIYQILTSLESDAAARLAMSKTNAKGLSELSKATDKMEAALLDDDLDGWARADHRFHRKVLELDGNKRLLAVARNLGDQSHRVRMTTLRLRERPLNSADEHREIITAIKQGNAERARELFRQHRDHSVVELLTILENLNLNHL